MLPFSPVQVGLCFFYKIQKKIASTSPLTMSSTSSFDLYKIQKKIASATVNVFAGVLGIGVGDKIQKKIASYCEKPMYISKHVVEDAVQNSKENSKPRDRSSICRTATPA